MENMLHAISLTNICSLLYLRNPQYYSHSFCDVNLLHIPEAIKFKANGIPLWVPFEERKSVFEANFQARNNPVANMKIYVR